MCLIALLAAFQLSAAPTPHDLPAVHLVRGGLPGADETLHRDLASALSVARDGDLLLLDPGRYSGPGNRGLVVNENVVIRGRAGAAETILDCEGLDRAFELRGGDVVLEGLTIRGGNQDLGGAVWLATGSARLERLVLEDNVAQIDGGAVLSEASTTLEVSECVLQRNSARLGGGIALFGRGDVAACVLKGNHASSSGGGLLASSLESMRVVDCLFRGNEADGLGGGLGSFLFANLTVDRCRILENRAELGGGCGLPAFFTTVYLTNCLVARNRADRAGGVYLYGSTGAIQGCTIVDNVASSSWPGGVRAGTFGSSSILIDSIVRDNRSENPSLLLQQVQSPCPSTGCFPDPTLGALYCNIQGVVGLPTNFDLDPLFVDPAGGDYHLQLGSPCIDAGLTISLNQLQLDIDGEPRVLGTAVDVGSDEVALRRARPWFAHD